MVILGKLIHPLGKLIHLARASSQLSAIWSSACGPATTACASAIRAWSAATAFGSRFGCMPHACVEPAGCFGSELWGVYRKYASGRQRLETIRLQQIRQLSGLRASVALPIIWRELSLQPYHHAWLVRAACFWNALTSSQGFHRKVALDAVFLALHRGASNWVSGLCHALSLVGYNLQLNSADMQNIIISDLRSCLSAQLAHAWEYVALNPRSCPQKVPACALICGGWLVRPTLR